MPQLVFVHGPGAGGCADAFEGQLRDFPESLAPTLPGHLKGTPCKDVLGYVEWLRGWLWAQGHTSDLILCGYTLGAAIALLYGLEHPDEVLGIAVTSGNIRATTPPPGRLELRLNAAAGDPVAYKEWFDFQREAMEWVEPELRERLMERHRQVGPMSQYHDLAKLFAFDVQDRISELKPRLLVVRGMDDANSRANDQRLLHEAVPGSTYLEMSKAGHFPATERPQEFNQALREFVATL